ncbi:MAG: hypothetical protein ACIAQU_12345 [Phycisphaerales bacterium JB064]
MFRLVLFVVVLGFLAARIFTDHHMWSQWLFVVPPEAWLLAIWLLAMLTSLLEPKGKGRLWARLGPLVVALVATVHVALVHWRLQNALLRPHGQTTLRVYHWNATEATDEALQAFLRDADPFALRHDAPAVVVLANPPLRLDWPEVTGMLADKELSRPELPQHFRRGGRFVIISGPPMTAAGWTSLGLRGKTTEPGLIDDGTAMFVRIELPDGPTTIWGWDWPSDPSRGRMAFVEPSLKAIADSRHLSFVSTAAGPLRQQEQTGFPPADIVAGDFNTGRGSVAVSRLLPGLDGAHEQAGIGPDYGWPRFIYYKNQDRTTVPFVGVDQAFVRSSMWRTTAYRMIDMGVGTHRAQEAILTAVVRPSDASDSRQEAPEAGN